MTQPPSKQSTNWFAIFSLTVLSAYFHAAMEWLFFVTKPSTLSTLSLFEKVKVLFVSGGIFAILLIAGLLLLSVPALLVRSPIWKDRLGLLRFAPSALMLAITTLILLDNFTYTLFKFGITSTDNAWRLIYTLIFILAFLWMFRFVKRTARTLKKSASFLSLGLLALSLAGIIPIYLSINSSLGARNLGTSQASANRPNIIILGSDGLSADYLSAYNDKVDTTPFLSQLIKTSLVAENAFPNASSTTASTTSALTGREPADVDVYRYPDILADENSFEHLPGILKRQGYKTVEIGTSYYVDAGQLNLLNGFEIVNGKSVSQPALEALRAVLGNSPSSFFVQTIMERASERLLHIFFIQNMENPFEEVNNPNVRMTDAERTDQIINLLKGSDQPLFIFSHYMDTHGPIFFSEGGEADTSSSNEKDWDVSLYKEAIQSFDHHVEEIYTYLAQSGKLDNTILVIYTDHGYRYVVNQRIPIIMHFPNDEHAGTRENNVEIIDIPVTLLNYLGIPQPEWMTGTSILESEPPAERKIISITAGSPKKINPPFFQIKIVQVIVCQKWYALNVQENSWKSGMIRGHTSPCPEENLPPDSDIRSLIVKYLADHGYNVSSLQ